MFRTKDDHRRSGHSNLAARMGRWSAAHWKTATFGWLAFVLVAFGLGVHHVHGQSLLFLPP